MNTMSVEAGWALTKAICEIIDDEMAQSADPALLRLRAEVLLQYNSEGSIPLTTEERDRLEFIAPSPRRRMTRIFSPPLISGLRSKQLPQAARARPARPYGAGSNVMCFGGWRD